MVLPSKCGTVQLAGKPESVSCVAALVACVLSAPLLAEGIGVGAACLNESG
jgi:hypothetical protein